MSEPMLVLHGDVPHTAAQELALCILNHRPYKMTGRADVDWVLDRLPVNDWWSFPNLPSGTTLVALETLLQRLGLGYAVVEDQDFHGNGDDEVSVLRAHDPVLGEARFLYGSSVSHTDANGVITRPYGRLLLSVDAITPTTLAQAQAWQTWLDGCRVRVARSAHATLDLLATSN